MGVQIRIERWGAAFSEWFMPENARLGGSLDQIDIEFVEAKRHRSC